MPASGVRQMRMVRCMAGWTHDLSPSGAGLNDFQIYLQIRRKSLRPALGTTTSGVEDTLPSTLHEESKDFSTGRLSPKRLSSSLLKPQISIEWAGNIHVSRPNNVRESIGIRTVVNYSGEAWLQTQFAKTSYKRGQGWPKQLWSLVRGPLPL